MEEEIKNPVNQAMDIKFKEGEKIQENWKKFYDYIKPFISQNEEMEKIGKELNSDLTLFYISDLALIMAVQGERMAHNLIIPKMFCLSCGKKIEEENNNQVSNHTEE